VIGEPPSYDDGCHDNSHDVSLMSVTSNGPTGLDGASVEIGDQILYDFPLEM